MLNGLLRDPEATRALFDRVGLFKDPELLEKYVVASEVTMGVVDLFLSRIFGAEKAALGNVSGDLRTLFDTLGCNGREDASSERLQAGGDERELEAKVAGLERQLCAMQRQLHLQGEVSRLAASVDGRLDEVVQECDRRISAAGEALRGDVRSQVSAVSEDVRRMKNDVSERARTCDVTALREELARLKEAEERLDHRVSDVEKKATAANRALLDELQRRVENLEAGLKSEFVYNGANPLGGIIAHLTSECGGNVHEKKVVEVTASSCSRDNAPRNAVDLGTNSQFGSESRPDQWIRYDFKGMRVVPTSYSIRSHRGCSPSSWVFEVSNDGSEGSWKVVDRRENYHALEDKNTHNFAISGKPGGSFRFVRLRQTGKCHGGYDDLFLSSLEVFGSLYH